MRGLKIEKKLLIMYLELLKDIKYAYYPNIGENLDFIVNNNLKNFKFIFF